MDNPQKIGRYEIIEELGRGAMGTVYRAKDPAMDRVVAVKTIISVVLDGVQGGEFRERFFREARAAGSLAHPGIVPVFDVGEQDGLPFLVMEFVKGQTLADMVKNGERLSLDRVREIGQQIAQALSYAHQRGVVHRDIKPANILMTSREAYGIERPKITDFGVAKLAEGQTTMTGQLLGTPAFMPPEQFTGAAVDGRADIFSLGVVLYLLATGEQPFPGESMTSVSYKVVHTNPVPPCKLNPSLSADLDRVIMKCLAKSPEDRYQTGDALAADLGEPRKGNTPPPAESPAFRATQMGHDPNATLVEPTGVAGTATGVPGTAAAVTGPVAPLEQPQPTAAKAGSRNWALVLVPLLVVFALAGGWYVLHSHAKTAVETAANPSSTPGTPAETGTASPEMPANPARKAAPPVRAIAAARKPEEKSGAGEIAPAHSAVNFNPRSLDPKENSRLKINAEEMPPNMPFKLEMNGKIYLSTTGAMVGADDKDLFVPPGVREFLVVVTSKGVTRESNIVSTEFKAKKKYDLKVELRTKGMPDGSGVPQGLYPDTEVVAELK
ncbi:MAG TPA: protein kinase [Candidatus Dormibacteraeota bacterium]|nr:protein kinase [Candidatus Dormibacteraeota bacterium]